ncbi:hypothetical protein MMC31_007445 [Peltigera leucophlebia]|nr:hypothetical protein [Peltigera leucophlebia]
MWIDGPYATQASPQSRGPTPKEVVAHAQFTFLSSDTPFFSSHIIKLPLITIGTRTAPVIQPGEPFQSKREDTCNNVTSFLWDLEKGTAIGQPIVREVSVHDERYFTVEQDVSVHVQHKGGGWIVTLVIVSIKRRLPKRFALHSSHAQTSDSKTMVTDAFYVCTELFAFAAFSSSQYLNLMVNVLAKEQSKTHDPHPIGM